MLDSFFSCWVWRGESRLQRITDNDLLQRIPLVTTPNPRYLRLDFFALGSWSVVFWRSSSLSISAHRGVSQSGKGMSLPSIASRLLENLE